MRLLRVALLIAVTWLAYPANGFAASLAPLRANWNSQAIQNRRTDADNLSRMRNSAMVRRFARAGLLVRVPIRTRRYYTRYIPAKYRYLRPWSKLFLDRLARDRKSTRLNSSHIPLSRMPSSA